MDWLDLLAVWGTLKSLLQHHSSKASILRRSAFFTVQLSHPYVTTGKTIALTRRTFVGKVMSLLFNMLSRLVITFLPRSKHLLISWFIILIISGFRFWTLSAEWPWTSCLTSLAQLYRMYFPSYRVLRKVKWNDDTKPQISGITISGM